MTTVKKLTVKVTYQVGLGDLKMPKNVYDQIVEAANEGDEIDLSDSRKYSDASDWLSANIRERDCFDWVVEIKDIS